MLKHSSSGIFLSFDLARRYTFAQSPQFSNVGRLALLGLVLSVAVLVIVLSVVNGFERELRERVLGLLPSVVVEFSDGANAAELARIDHFKDTVASPYIRGQILLVSDGEISAAELTGIVPQDYANMTQIFDYTKEKEPNVLQEDQFGVVLGAGVAARLKVMQGDDVRLVMPVAGIGAAGAVPRQRRMQVVDVLHSESLLDAQSAFVHLAIAKRLFREVRPHGIHLSSSELFNLGSLVDDLYTTFGEERIRVRTWMDRYGSLYQAVAVQKLTLFFLLLFLVAVAAFNLVSGLVMMVEQRKADIAVLNTLGLRAPGVMSLFVILGLVMAVGGIVLGLVVGVLIATWLPDWFAALSSLFEAQLMSQYFINYLPSEVRVADIGTIAGLSFVLAVLATIYPAWRATRQPPVEVLAHE